MGTAGTANPSIPQNGTRVDAILMASGFSRRFGSQNKLLANFNGKPLARLALELACSLPAISHVWFVCAQPQVAALAKGLPATVIHNATPELGACRSVQLGVAASSADYYLFFPCDQPLLDACTVNTVINAQQPGAIVQPAYRQAPGSPVLFSACYRKELLSLQPGQHAREIKKRHTEQLLTIHINHPEPLMDVDTQSDLQELLQRSKNHPLR